MLGRVIEKVTGRDYESYIREDVLAPMGIGRMWIGSSRPQCACPDEVKYYDVPDAPQLTSVFPDLPGDVPMPYGAFDLRTLDSHGGWIGSAVDFLKLITAIDSDYTEHTFLLRASVEQTLARPAAPIASPSADTFYGFGIWVRPGSDHRDWWHTGSIPGSALQFVRDGKDGVAWVILLNRRPTSNFRKDLERLGWEAIDRISSFPSNDLFANYSSRSVSA